MQSIMKSKIVQISAIISTVLVLFSFSLKVQQTPEWVVPAKYKNMKNPTTVDEKTLALVAKQLYLKHCKSCHGRKGLGNGPMAKNLEAFYIDFSTEEFQSQSDGELFYKTSEGTNQKPSFKKKLSETDIWFIVHYIRTLGE